jgi:hypothetical protein
MAKILETETYLVSYFLFFLCSFLLIYEYIFCYRNFVIIAVSIDIYCDKDRSSQKIAVENAILCFEIYMPCLGKMHLF